MQAQGRRSFGSGARGLIWSAAGAAGIPVDIGWHQRGAVVANVCQRTDMQLLGRMAGELGNDLAASR